ncbi:MAG: RuBisCO large subunit C-terminal-like domain-containing protein [Lamprobacter sp.]|uniref:RuBisCO large subunit C-terminal-like domain-containing protein n=1 Tax=Lamprobacter sp. TaxID=3100796 RepID=UPI002B25D4E2|nr:RuBisCO large subunit C-terminal-like domain-containing protein [Lamprobacter sp.]MEA3639851.1 RuBisCO large subunit C-terminal-like domain-containing protein [Lamprobacter sp.]
MTPGSTLSLSGERFTAVYRLSGTAAEVEARARAICLEQTVEFPEALIPNQAIRTQIVGTIAEIEPCSSNRSGTNSSTGQTTSSSPDSSTSHGTDSMSSASGSSDSADPDSSDESPCSFEVSIRYPIETAGREFTQLLNVLFGNVALQPGVRLQRIELPPALLQHYQGPRFGIAGLRQQLGITDRPLLCTALKPMGLSPTELAEMAYRLALGGIDLIKDDHGLSDQTFCPFDERVSRCAEAIARANQQTGRTSLYLPNITAPADELNARAERARERGAGGLLLCPGLTGLDSLRRLAADDQIALPILSHPALLGGLSLGPSQGLAHGLLFGTLTRLAGADATIFPSFGGRFAFTAAECQAIAAAAKAPLAGLAPIWPVPAGGMRLEQVPELVTFYGRDSMLLIGGDLHAGEELTARCQAFLRLVRKAPEQTPKD